MNHSLYFLFRFLLLLVGLNMSVAASSQQSAHYAIYNYRNDGDFNAFLNINVDSITYSNIDTLGVEHDDVVVQEVWTCDSLYRIPIDAIDSIGFQAPKTIIKKDVYRLTEEHIPYTKQVDSLSIVFDSTIPLHLMPIVGEVLVSETFAHPFEDGFVGRVNEIINHGATIEVKCKDATLTDIYQQLLAVGTLVSEERNAGSRSMHHPKRLLGFDDVDKNGIETFQIDEVTLSHKDFDLLSIKYTPQLSVEYIIYIHEDDPIHLKLLLSGKHAFKLNLNLFKEKKESSPNSSSADDTERGQKWLVDVPLPYFYGFSPTFKLGLYYKLGGSVSVSGVIPVTIEHSLGVEYHGSNLSIDNVNILKSFDMDIGQPDLKFNVEGHLAGGLAADVGVKFLHQKIASIDAILNMGPKLSTSFSVSTADVIANPSIYSLLKDTKLKAEFDIGFDGKYTLLTKTADIVPGKGWPGVKSVNKKESGPVNLGFEWSWDLFECYLLPRFTNHSLVNYSNKEFTFKTSTERELFFPVKLGAMLKGPDEIPRYYIHDKTYWGVDDSWAAPFVTKFANINMGESYICQPVVEVLGIKLPATPNTYVDTNHLLLAPRQAKELKILEIYPILTTHYKGPVNINILDDKVVSCTYDETTGLFEVKGLKEGETILRIGARDLNKSYVYHVTVSKSGGNAEIDDLPGEKL